MLRVSHLGEGACYFDRQHRNLVVCLMFRQAYRLFADSSIIRYLSKFELLYKKSNRPNLERVHRLAQKMDMPILDAIKIGTAFELILKAELLRRGFVVHEMKDSNLKKSQREYAIKILDIKRMEKVTNSRGNAFPIQCLSTKTIKLSWILYGLNYKNIINYPETVFDVLRKINHTRNSLHFIPIMGRVFSKEVLDEYIILRKLINERIVKIYNRRICEEGFSGHMLKYI